MTVQPNSINFQLKAATLDKLFEDWLKIVKEHPNRVSSHYNSFNYVTKEYSKDGKAMVDVEPYFKGMFSLVLKDSVTEEYDDLE